MSETLQTNKESVIRHLKTPSDLENLLQTNPGLILIKLGATWCKPCKKIDPLVMAWFDKFNHPSVTRVILDIDECINLYGFYKKKRVVKGVPTILAYYDENNHYIPDDITFGSDENETNAFFKRCVDYMNG